MLLNAITPRISDFTNPETNRFSEATTKLKSASKLDSNRLAEPNLDRAKYSYHEQSEYLASHKSPLSISHHEPHENELPQSESFTPNQNLVKDFCFQYLEVPHGFDLHNVIPYRYYLKKNHIIQELDLNQKGAYYLNSLVIYTEVIAVIEIHNLILTNNEITGLPECFNYHNFITFLDISNNNLINLTHLPPNLVKLKLNSNPYLKKLTGLKYLKNLKYLEMETCNLKEIPSPEFLASLFNLEEFYLAGNLLTDLPSEILFCRSLKILDLSENKFSSNQFDQKMMQIIDLQDVSNNMTKIQEDIIVDAHSDFYGDVIQVKQIVDNNNKIQKASENLHLDNLNNNSDSMDFQKRIEENSNQETKLIKKCSKNYLPILHKFKNLAELNISGNELKYFKCPESVRNLKIHQNQLVEFEITDGLEILNLHSNQLKSIDCRDKTNLEYLNLRSNQMMKMPDYVYHCTGMSCPYEERAALRCGSRP